MRTGKRTVLTVVGSVLIAVAVALLFVHENGKQDSKTTQATEEGESDNLFV